MLKVGAKRISNEQGLCRRAVLRKGRWSEMDEMNVDGAYVRTDAIF